RSQFRNPATESLLLPCAPRQCVPRSKISFGARPIVPPDPEASPLATNIQPRWGWFSCTPISYSLREYPHHLLLTTLLSSLLTLTLPSFSTLSSCTSRKSGTSSNHVPVQDSMSVRNRSSEGARSS